MERGERRKRERRRGQERRRREKEEGQEDARCNEGERVGKRRG